MFRKLVCGTVVNLYDSRGTEILSSRFKSIEPATPWLGFEPRYPCGSSLQEFCSRLVQYQVMRPRHYLCAANDRGAPTKLASGGCDHGTSSFMLLACRDQKTFAFCVCDHGTILMGKRILYKIMLKVIISLI